MNENLNVLATNELKLATLYHIRDLLALIQQNINLIANGGQGNTVIQTGDNLFSIAAKYYNDATLWTAIAEENIDILLDDNGFINPNLSGIKTIIIPPKPSTESKGILSV